LTPPSPGTAGPGRSFFPSTHHEETTPMRFNSRQLLLVALTAIAFACATVSQAGDDKGFKPLFNGKNLKGWKTFLRDTDKGDPKTVFTVKDGEIQCSGDPWGYFYTEKSYKNYVIRYSWTYPKNQPDKTTMNSG